MTMTSVPAFAQTPDTAPALLTLAVGNLASLNPTNIVPAFTAGPNGALITRISAIPRGSVTATGVYMFKSVDSGATQHFKDSVSMPLQTITAGGNIVPTVFPNYSEARPMRIGAGEILSFGLGVAQANGVDVDIEYTNY
jgi:hypothetical protein